MAILGLGYNRGADLSPDKITSQTTAQVGLCDVQVNIDLTKSLTREDVILILGAVERVLEDGRQTLASGITL